MLTEVFRADPTNVGDWHSRPGEYVSFGQPTRLVDVWDVTPDESGAYVVGGGGLINGSFPRLQPLIEAAGPRTVVWGVGHNLTVDVAAGFVPREPLVYPSWLADAALVGVRDFGAQFEWAPCPSCLHELFDRPQPIQHDVVLFEHKRVSTGITGLPTLRNDVESIGEVLAFLASGDTVLTNSYHGAYWALLLGRRVIAFPFASKFYGFKHPIALGRPDAWRAQHAQAIAHPSALQECRDATLAFHTRAMDVLTSVTRAPHRVRAGGARSSDVVERWLQRLSPAPLQKLTARDGVEPSPDAQALVRYVAASADGHAPTEGWGGISDLGNVGQDGVLPVVVSYFTKGTPYEVEAGRLRQSCLDARVDHVIEGVEPQGSWERNCAMKAEFCQRIWRELGRPILWVDADAVVRRRPRLLASCEADVAIHKLAGYEFLSGTLFFNQTAAAKDLLDAWVERCRREPDIWDQKHLHAAWQEVSAVRSLVTLWLPRSYVRIFDHPDLPGELPVIVHHQASRRLKTVVASSASPASAADAALVELELELARVRDAVCRERMIELGQRMAASGVRDCQIYGSAEAGRALARVAGELGIRVAGFVRSEDVAAGEAVDGLRVRAVSDAASQGCHVYAIGSFSSSPAILGALESAYRGRAARYTVWLPQGPAPEPIEPSRMLDTLRAVLTRP